MQTTDVSVRFTPRMALEKRDREWQQAFTSGVGDGLLIGSIKWLFGCQFWRWLFCLHLTKSLRWYGTLDTEYPNFETADAVLRDLIDRYLLLWGAVNVGVYIFAVYTACAPATDFRFCPLLSILALLPVYRIGELLAVVAELHAVRRWKPLNPLRELAAALWNFLEIVVCFAVLHLCVHASVKDAYQGIDRTGLTAMYFSLVSITTLGFGDVFPKCLAGEALVMVEVFLGICFLSVVVARMVASPTAEEQGPRTPESPSA